MNPQCYVCEHADRPSLVQLLALYADRESHKSTIHSVTDRQTDRRLDIGVRARVISSPPDSGKAVIFRAKAKFFGQKEASSRNEFFCIY